MSRQRQYNTMVETFRVPPDVDELNAFVVRLFADTDEDERYWVDFDVTQVTCLEQMSDGSKSPRYTKAGAVNSMDVTDDIELAEHVVEGFIKWDGCTQFNSDVHIDHVEDLRLLHRAIEEARDGAARIMPGKMINDEYKT